MTFGDIAYVGAFLVLPVIVAAWCLWTVRVLGRRRAARAAGPALIEPGEITEELPRPPRPPRDWAAAVQPLRRHAARAAPRRPFRPPAYRGRSRGVVRRLTPR